MEALRASQIVKPAPPSYSKVRFNNEITLGHLLTAASMLVAAFVVWMHLNTRVAVMEENQARMEKVVEALAHQQNEISQVQTRIVTIMEYQLKMKKPGE